MRRHNKSLQAAKGYQVAANRIEWATYNNIDCMYDLIFEQTISAGVARALDPSDYYWVDAMGDRPDIMDKSVGMQVKVEMTHPNWILVGDEVGIDISQKDDRRVGGQKFESERNKS